MVGLRLAAECEYSEDPTLVQTYPMIGLYFPKPETVTLLDVARQIYDEWPELNPGAPPLKIKALVNKARPLIRYSSKKNLSEVFLDQGKAETDHLDQDGVVSVVLDRSSFPDLPQDPSAAPLPNPYLELSNAYASASIQQPTSVNGLQSSLQASTLTQREARKRKRKSEPILARDLSGQNTYGNQAPGQAAPTPSARKKSRKSEPAQPAQTPVRLPPTVADMVWPSQYTPARIEEMRREAAEQIEKGKRRIDRVREELTKPNLDKTIKGILLTIIKDWDLLHPGPGQPRAYKTSRLEARIERSFEKLQSIGAALESSDSESESYASDSSSEADAVSLSAAASQSDPASQSDSGDESDADREVAETIFADFFDDEAQAEEDEDEDEDEENEDEDEDEEDEDEDEDEENVDGFEDAEKGGQEDAESEGFETSESHQQESGNEFEAESDAEDSEDEARRAITKPKSGGPADPQVGASETPEKESQASAATSAPDSAKRSVGLLKGLLTNRQKLEEFKQAQRRKRRLPDVYDVSDHSTSDAEAGDIYADGTSSKIRKIRGRT
ncbi:hypothetical protein N7470_002672 [Penicillium chermesinum]|nr:hypothetical protein N7470_002672 [Penicillium chermesinum]